MSPRIRRIGLWIALILYAGCGPRQPNWKFRPSFYYWKSTMDLSSDDLAGFSNWGVKRLYIHFFDVAWDAGRHAALPLKSIRFSQDCRFPAEVVPVVFITGEALEKTPGPQRSDLARQIVGRVIAISRAMTRMPIPELQLDCDWTPINRKAYFDLLGLVRAQLKKAVPEARLTCTIRLHQVKFVRTTGVPPVDGGVLMVYHTTSPTQLGTQDTILDVDTAESYLDRLADYPLPLDVALPMFTWVVQFNRSHQPINILTDVGEQDLAQNAAFKAKGKRIYRAVSSSFLGSQRIMEGDTLKVDGPSMEDARRMVRFIKPRLKEAGGHLILYHYDEANLRRFIDGDPGKLKSLYNL